MILAYSLIPLDIQDSCFSLMLVYGLSRSSTVTAASALMLEDTVLGWIDIKIQRLG